MGFMDFVKSAGAKILGSSPNDSEAIKNHIVQAFGGKIKDLSVAYADGTVTLSGIAISQAQKEKAILIAGNVSGVERVNGEALSVEISEAAPDEEQHVPNATLAQRVERTTYYTVEKGDTLSGIAKKVYKDGSKYPALFDANREVIKDPDLIYPGQTIRVPELTH